LWSRQSLCHFCQFIHDWQENDIHDKWGMCTLHTKYFINSDWLLHV